MRPSPAGPAYVPDTEPGTDPAGRGPEPLKIYFDDAQYDVQQSVQTLDWDEWLAIFDKMNYSFAYSEDGEDDRYHEVRGGQN